MIDWKEKVPLLIASLATLVALLWLPWGKHQGYWWFANQNNDAVELTVIWGGYFLWRSLSKPKSD